jgi:hypothetical protein
LEENLAIMQHKIGTWEKIGHYLTDKLALGRKLAIM